MTGQSPFLQPGRLAGIASRGGIRLFALEASRSFAEAIASRLDLALSPLEETEFADGEHKARPLGSVAGQDVYVVHSLYGEVQRSIGDKLLRLLFLIDTLADAGAARVTAVLPYLCYARQERQTLPQDPIATRCLARLFESVGTTRVLTMDVHDLAAFQNAYRCRTSHFEAHSLFAAYFADRLGDAAVAVVSPDAGGVKRAERFRRRLEDTLSREAPLAVMEKHRDGRMLRGGSLAGDVKGRTAIIIDDMISTGSTMLGAALACRKRGATAVFGIASHAVLAPGAETVLTHPALDRVVITDSIPPLRLDPALLHSRVEVLSAAPLFADAIGALHDGAGPLAGTFEA